MYVQFLNPRVYFRQALHLTCLCVSIYFFFLAVLQFFCVIAFILMFSIVIISTWSTNLVVNSNLLLSSHMVILVAGSESLHVYVVVGYIWGRRNEWDHLNIIMVNIHFRTGPLLMYWSIEVENSGTRSRTFACFHFSFSFCPIFCTFYPLFFILFSVNPTKTLSYKVPVETGKLN